MIVCERSDRDERWRWRFVHDEIVMARHGKSLSLARKQGTEPGFATEAEARADAEETCKLMGTFIGMVAQPDPKQVMDLEVTIAEIGPAKVDPT